MKILLLTQYYPPESGAPQNRLSDFAKRLVRWGHWVEVLTALPNYPQNVVYPNYVGRENSTEILEGVTVHRVGIYVPRQKSFWKRIFHYCSFAWNAAWKGLKLVSPDIDIILMESPPLFVAGAGIYLSQRLKAKLVVNISDLWPQTAVELGILRKGPFVWMAQCLEAQMYERASLITAQTEGIVKDIKTRFPKKKVILFPNGVDGNCYRNIGSQNGVRQRMDLQEGHFVIGYAGILGHAQKLDQILDAAKLLKDVPQVCFLLIGDGPCKDHVVRRIAQEKIHNAKWYPRIPPGEMPKVYAVMDAGCVPLGKEKIFEGARPSKLFEMMAAGLPILLCARGESADILQAPEGGRAGISVPPEEPEQLAQQVRYLIGHPGEARDMGECGRKYVLANFEREQIARNLEKELAAIL